MVLNIVTMTIDTTDAVNITMFTGSDIHCTCGVWSEENFFTHTLCMYVPLAVYVLRTLLYVLV